VPISKIRCEGKFYKTSADLAEELAMQYQEEDSMDFISHSSLVTKLVALIKWHRYVKDDLTLEKAIICQM
jgi:hypothetical protein